MKKNIIVVEEIFPAIETTPEPVIEQVPLAPDESAAPADETVSTIPAASSDTAPHVDPLNPDTVAEFRQYLRNKLPDGYLTKGILGTSASGKPYTRVEYIRDYPQALAELLTNDPTPLSAAAFNKMLLTPIRKHQRRGVATEAKVSCAASMVPAAMALISKRKAPLLLLEIITISRSVVDGPSFDAFADHMAALHAYLLMQEQQKGGD